VLVLLDRQGKQLRSGQIAELIGDYQDGGTQELVFAIGPADGWSHTALTAADFKLSFGPITLPHELARLVLAEQLYRAFTILNRHPYHSGH
jgi:23S rRNA (pseudouridine1915-N3)-methyltransferase